MAQKSEKLWIFNGEVKKNPIRIHFRLTNLVWFGFSGVDCGWTQWENRTVPAVEMKNIRKGTRVRAHFGQSNFSLFQQKRKKEISLILIIFAYFKVQKKKRKKENGQKNWSFFHFSNFEVRFKNTKKYYKRLKAIFCYFLFSCYC